MQEPIKLGLIYGSARKGRFCDVVARWVAQEVEKTGRFTIELIDPATDLPAVGEAGSGRSLRQKVADAEAFIVVTPEYNHGYAAPLKSLIDSVGQEWHAKPVAFVSYGGISGGLRAVEQLRLVFAELHAMTVRDSVSFASAWEQFEESGNLREPERARRSLNAMLKRLEWWAIALRHGREAMPYATAA